MDDAIRSPQRRLARAAAWWALAIALAVATFLAYLRPDLVVELGNRFLLLCW